MKYYKLLTKQGYSGDCFIVDKIYPETFTEGNIKDYYSVKEMSENHPSSWEEVLAGEYFVQEGVMPEYFAIKRVEGNPLWGKYIDWLNTKYSKNIGGEARCFYGYAGFSLSKINMYEVKLSHFKNNPVELTLEQWDKIINKTMEENDKEIIGWKLKEDCEQYKQAALNIINQSKFYNFAEGYNFETKSTNESDLKKAGVLELWFEPVYKEKILQFGGYDVTFEKVTSGVRITCNGETGTLSQIKEIYNHFNSSKKNFSFGSQIVKEVNYTNGKWDLEIQIMSPISIKIGCTTGTWEEFAAIYEEAKSML